MKVWQLIFSNIAYMAGIASLVAIIILLLRKAFDKKISPKWKFAMWGLLLISLIIPFRITLYANNGSFYTISSLVDYSEKAKNILAIHRYGKILTIVWIIGMISLGLLYTINSLIMKRKIGKEEIKDKRILKIFQEAKEKMEIKREIKVVNQKEKITPCIYGIMHPKILLTEEITQKSDEVITHILMHELAHYKRKDIWLNKLLLVITIIYWFNPIIWFCFKQIRQDMELKADELVLNKLPKEKEKEYAKSLVNILPISQEDKMTTRLLYVTDGKKNMERRIKMIKLAKQFKEYKTLIGVTTLVLTICIGVLTFTQIKPKEENEIINHTKYFQTPDRMVYKVKGKDEYYVYTSEKADYDTLLNQLTKCIEGGIGEGARLSQEEMKKIEQEENYIELDYDTISKNYVIVYQKENCNVIRRTDEGGIVVKNNIQQKKELEKLLEKQIKNKTECYQMLENKEYRVLEPISYEVPSWSNELKKYEQGIYSVRLGTKQAWERFQENNKITISQEIPEEQFQKTNVIATITKYQIGKVETRIGGITFYFTGEENKEKYYVNIYCVSKAVNINCVYRNFTETNQKESTAKTIEGIITKIEGNTYWIQNEKLETKKLILENQKIINNRTEKEIAIKEIQEQDKIQISKAIQNEEEIFLTEESNIRVTRNVKGEDLKKELLDAQEVSMTIEKLTEQGNNILLTGKITDYYSEYEQANFEVQIAVDKDTKIFSETKNQLEELQKMEERRDTIFVTFRKTEKEQGKLVAENIEVMGC